MQQPKRKRRNVRRRRKRRVDHSQSVGRMRKHESRLSAKLHLQATQVVRNLASSKGSTHCNSLPQILSTASVLRKSKFSMSGSTVAKDSGSRGGDSLRGNDLAGNLKWIPPTITSGIHKRAAAVIGLRSVRKQPSPLRSPSRGSLVRSRAEARKHLSRTWQYRPTQSMPEL